MTTETQEETMGAEIEIRNLRVAVETGSLISFKTTGTGYNEVLIVDRDRWEALGKPTYIVANIRAETFAESTQ